MSFLYFVGGYQLLDLPDMSSKGLFLINVNGQVVLPKEVKLGINYTLVPKGGDYYYFRVNEHLQNALNLTLSKKFMKNRLNVSLFANDVFNTNKVDAITKHQPSVRFSQKADSRSFGLTLNYKIPTKNRLAKENQNMLLENQKEGKDGLFNN